MWLVFDGAQLAFAPALRPHLIQYPQRTNEPVPTQKGMKETQDAYVSRCSTGFVRAFLQPVHAVCLCPVKKSPYPVACALVVCGNAAALQGPDWCQLLGRVGDEVMLALLMHGSIFAPLPGGGNLLQLTGRPLSLVSDV